MFKILFEFIFIIVRKTEITLIHPYGKTIKSNNIFFTKKIF